MWRRDVNRSAIRMASIVAHGDAPLETSGRHHNPARDGRMAAVIGYPLLLDVVGRRVLVVGAGTVAARRIRALVEAGAQVEVVAPEVSDEVAGAAVTLQRRRFEAADLDGAWLAFACTDDPAVNAQVAAACEARRVFCVR